MEKLFNKFPKIFYNNTHCIDLSRRIKISNESRRNVNLFYPLELKAGFRCDLLADAYYEDSELDWLIYLSNEIVDPYYGWYLNELEFDAFIHTKYGEMADAVKQTKYYRNNWSNDHTEISPGYYNYTLAYDQKQYYTPTYGPGAKILSYKRKQADWVVNTNQILQYEIDTDGFTNGEIIDIKTGGSIVGGGEVITSNSSTVIIQHVSGNTTANSTWTKQLIGESSNTIANTANGSVVYSIISNAESVFWTRVSLYDWEVEQNEAKKHIYVMDANYTLDTANQFRKLMKE